MGDFRPSLLCLCLTLFTPAIIASVGIRCLVSQVTKSKADTDSFDRKRNTSDPSKRIFVMTIINIDLRCEMRLRRSFWVKWRLGRNQSKPRVPNKVITRRIKISIVPKSSLDTSCWTCYPRVRSPLVRVVCVLKLAFIRIKSFSY